MYAGIIITLVSLILPWFGSQALTAPSETIVTTAEGLLIAVVLCVSVSLWVILMDKKAKQWEKTLLTVEMIIASFVFFVIAIPVGLGMMPGWRGANPTADRSIKILDTTSEYLLITAVVLACAVVLVFLVQYVDELVLERRGPFPANKIDRSI
jgi:hypothetical protein